MGSRQAVVDLYETRLEHRAKNYERLKGFFQRQLDKKEKNASELRVELNEARKNGKRLSTARKKQNETSMLQSRTWRESG